MIKKALCHALFAMALVLTGLLGCGAALAQIRMTDSSAVNLPLAIGASGVLEFRLRNQGNATASTSMGFSGVGFEQPPKYVVTPISDCALPAQFSQEPISLPAGGEIHCRYQITRQANATGDLGVGFNLIDNLNTVQSKLFRVGDLTRLRLNQTIERQPAPGVAGRVRITLSNDGPTAIGLLDYGNCAYPFGSTALVTVVGGDCVAGSAALCFTGGIGTGFSVTNLAVGSSKICTLEWTATPSNRLIQLSLLSLTKDSDGGINLLNTDESSNELVVQGVASVQQIPLLNALGLYGLLLLTGVLGAWRLRK